MRITSIETSGLANDINYSGLTGLVFISGPPFSGKSTLLNAVTGTVLGYVPRLGKTNGATFEMAAGNNLIINAELDNGQGITRRWTKTKSGASLDTTAPEWLKDQKFITLNTGEYFSLTPSERIRYLFANTNIISDVDAKDVWDAFAKDWPDHQLSEALQSHSSLACTKVLESLSESVVDGISALLEPKKGWVAERVRQLKGRVDDTVGAVRVMSELKVKHAAHTAPQSVLEAKLKGLTEKRDALVAAKAEQEGRAGLKEEYARRVEAALTANSTKIKLSEELEKLERRRAAFAEDYRDSQKRGLEAVAELKTLEEKLSVANLAVGGAEAVLKSLTTRVKELEREIAEIEEMASCPTCRGKAKGWQKVARESITAEIAPVQEEIKETETRLIQLQSEASNLQSDRDRELANAKGFEAKVSEITKEGKVVAASMSSLAAEIKGLEVIIAAGQEAQNKSVESVEPQEYDSQIADVDKEIAAVKIERDTAKSNNDEILRAEAAVGEHQDAADALAFFEALRKSLKEQQEQIIDNLFQSLLQEINAFTKGILKSKVVYRGGDLGYVNPDTKTFVTHRTMSGTESRVLHTATAVALASKQLFKPIILDEFDMDDPTLAAVMNRFAEFLKDGKVDQVFIARTTGPTGPTGFKIKGDWTQVQTIPDESPAEAIA